MTRYAWKEVLLTLLLGSGVTVAAWWFSPWLALAPGALTVFLLSFYRDPPRRTPADPRLLVAPADGQVVAISRLPAAEGDPAQLSIMIFLSVLNVHVNRAPCAGRVCDIVYRPGKFLNALKEASSAENEANTISLAPAPPIPGPVQVRQIAGVLARRIVCATQIGAELGRGERYGMIKLGSRTELIVPDDPQWRVRTSIGDAVRGGRTILLEWTGEAQAP